MLTLWTFNFLWIAQIYMYNWLSHVLMTLSDSSQMFNFELGGTTYPRCPRGSWERRGRQRQRQETGRRMCCLCVLVAQSPWGCAVMLSSVWCQGFVLVTHTVTLSSTSDSGKSLLIGESAQCRVWEREAEKWEEYTSVLSRGDMCVNTTACVLICGSSMLHSFIHEP